MDQVVWLMAFGLWGNKIDLHHDKKKINNNKKKQFLNSFRQPEKQEFMFQRLRTIDLVVIDRYYDNLMGERTPK